MRACIVARRFYETNSHMQQFARALADRGDRVDVIAACRPGLPKYEVCEGVHVHRIHQRTIDETGLAVYLFRFLLFFLHASVCIARRHLKAPYDLIHVQSVPDILVFSAMVPKLFGTPVILDLRDVIPELAVTRFRVREGSIPYKLLLLSEKLSTAFADHVLVANPIWCERVSSRSAGRDKCTMINYAPDPALFYKRRERGRDGKFVMMYPGCTLSWHQGVDIAIRALPKILRVVPQAELHIYGEGSARQPLEVLAAQLGVGQAVRFFNLVPLATLVERMADSDLAIEPKRASDRFGNEAASTKTPEFLAMGIPVVASRTAIAARLWDDSQLRYFRSEDEEDLAQAVLSVYQDADLSGRLRENRAVQQKEAWAALRTKYRALADRLVARKSHAAHPQGAAA